MVRYRAVAIHTEFKIMKKPCNNEIPEERKVAYTCIHIDFNTYDEALRN